jgi:hypothetical protein
MIVLQVEGVAWATRAAVATAANNLWPHVAPLADTASIIAAAPIYQITSERLIVLDWLYQDLIYDVVIIFVANVADVDVLIC